MAETTLTDVETTLIEASNLLYGMKGVPHVYYRYVAASLAIDDAIRAVQAWKEEERDPHQ